MLERGGLQSRTFGDLWMNDGPVWEVTSVQVTLFPRAVGFSELGISQEAPSEISFVSVFTVGKALCLDSWQSKPSVQDSV